jgi:tetratricopeptide (TPR) repeat protein
MQPEVSNDFGARKLIADDDRLMIHNHQFASGNTGVLHLVDAPERMIEAHREFLDETMRVDIFGIKSGGNIDDELIAPLRPEIPTLKPGQTYLLETVIRTLKLGHLFTQGTVDSNEVWLEVTLKSGDRMIGRSGALNERGEVDRWSHFVNVFMLDKDGNRINRRNAQDIFTPLYNHQIPPGAGQVVHYGFTLPDDLDQPLEITIKLNYRKFDREYLDIIKAETKNERTDNLPILTLAEDSITLPVEGAAIPAVSPDREIPLWQRWNDYGIGLFLEGKAELKQAEAAFRKVEELGRYDGPLNLARVLHREGGRTDEAAEAIVRASEYDEPAAPEWTLSWLSGLINREQLRLKEAEENFRSVLYGVTEERIARGFDFSRDYRIINLLGQTLFDRAQQIRTDERKKDRDTLLRQAAMEFEKALLIDSENVSAHYNLGQIYDRLNEPDRAHKHKTLHQKYKPDDTAQSRSIRLAREKYPAGNHAAEPLVIYPLQRAGAPGLPDQTQDVSSLTEETTP